MRRLIDEYSVSPPFEITVEANPESCDDDFLQAAMEAGVNRLSIGVQSFNEDSRKAVNRAGQGKLLRERLEKIAGHFPENSSRTFSMDLICGLPFQNEEILIRDIENAIEYRPAHVSLYSLTVDPLTPLGKRLAKGLVHLPKADEADRLWITGRDKLENSGYAQYEVSNFSLAGRESRHNLRYWRMENWLGLGPSAGSTIINDQTGTGARITYNADIDKWLERRPGIAAPRTTENLDTPMLIKETLLMGFRLLSGPDNALFGRRFKKSIEELIPKTINAWRGRGLFSACSKAAGRDRTALTRDGLLFLNSFLVEAFMELEAH